MTVKRHRSSHPPRLRNAPLPTGRSAAGVRQRYVGAPPRTPVPRRRPAQGKRRNAVARSGGGWVAAKAQTCCDGFVAPQWGAGVTSDAPTFGGWSCGGGWRFSGRPGWRPYVWRMDMWRLSGRMDGFAGRTPSELHEARRGQVHPRHDEAVGAGELQNPLARRPGLGRIHVVGRAEVQVGQL